MAAGDIEIPTRERRASRRRPGARPPEPERIPPRSGLSREEVIANQRRRIFDGLAAALAYHGYGDTKVTDVVELAGVSRATFYEHFEGKEACFSAAYEDAVEQLVGVVRQAATGERAWANRVSVCLSAGLEFLATDPPRAHLLLVESLAAARPARLEHERSLQRLAAALHPPDVDPRKEVLRHEAALLLAGGLVSRLSGLVLANEAERLPELHEALLQYLIAPILATSGTHAAEVAQAQQA
jgi:AcrR family transcriptional regulator